LPLAEFSVVSSILPALVEMKDWLASAKRTSCVQYCSAQVLLRCKLSKFLQNSWDFALAPGTTFAHPVAGRDMRQPFARLCTG
jgi:hypothetical protein